ncbi:MAG: hypothetical protein ACK5MD_11145, partial [Flavobacteriales bacterium]
MKQTLLTLDLSQYEFWQGSHRNKEVIWVKFPKDFQLLGELKKHTKPIWSQSQKCWYVKDNLFNRKLFVLPEKPLGKTALSKIT